MQKFFIDEEGHLQYMTDTVVVLAEADLSTDSDISCVEDSYGIMTIAEPWGEDPWEGYNLCACCRDRPKSGCCNGELLEGESIADRVSAQGSLRFMSHDDLINSGLLYLTDVVPDMINGSGQRVATKLYSEFFLEASDALIDREFRMEQVGDYASPIQPI